SLSSSGRSSSRSGSSLPRWPPPASAFQGEGPPRRSATVAGAPRLFRAYSGQQQRPQLAFVLHAGQRDDLVARLKAALWGGYRRPAVVNDDEDERVLGERDVADRLAQGGRLRRDRSFHQLQVGLSQRAEVDERLLRQPLLDLLHDQVRARDR